MSGVQRIVEALNPELVSPAMELPMHESCESWLGIFSSPFPNSTALDVSKLLASFSCDGSFASVPVSVGAARFSLLLNADGSYVTRTSLVCSGAASFARSSFVFEALWKEVISLWMDSVSNGMPLLRSTGW